MNFPAQLRNITHLQKRDFSLVYDRTAREETPLVTARVHRWSPSTLPHPRTEAHPRIPSQKYRTLCRNTFVGLYVEIYPSQDTSFSTVISRMAWDIYNHPLDSRTTLHVGSGTDLSSVQKRRCWRCFSKSNNLVLSLRASLKHRADQGNATGVIFSKCL